MRKLFVTGIGTGIGKTLVSAILTEALHADYWKPIQAGTDPETDTQTVKRLISNKQSVLHKEQYVLKAPLSPHHAAALENITLKLSDFVIPQSENTHIIIEGAGGLLVPLNNQETNLDLIRELEAEIVLVSRNYLGSINHTLLTLSAIKSAGLPFAGLVFSGDPYPEGEERILSEFPVLITARVNEEAIINQHCVSRYASVFRNLFIP